MERDRTQPSADAEDGEPLDLLRPGALIDGKYEVAALLGKGGMSVVYEATHYLTRRRVAVKCLRRASSSLDPRRLLQEGRAIARIEHPHVVQVLDLGFHDERPYLVMERLRGRSLSEHLLEQGGFDLPSALPLLDPVLDAAHRFHEAGVVHRDLKPANLFLVDDGVSAPYLKILDFGIASLVPQAGDSVENQKLTASGTSIGTPLYMSPEQLRWQKVDRRSDVFALGAIVYEMVTGQRAFPAHDVMELMLLLGSEDASERAERLERAVPSLGAVLAKALANQPEARFQSAEEFRLALCQASPAGDTELAPARPAPARRQPAQGEAQPRGRGRARQRWALGFLLAIVGAGTVAALVIERRPPAGATTTVQASLVEGVPGPAAGTERAELPPANEVSSKPASTPAIEPPATANERAGKPSKKTGSMPKGIPEP